MAVKIILKNSSREDKRPTPAQIADNGELALNYNAAGAFLSCRDSDGNIQQVGGVKLSDDEPNDPVLGTFWLETSTDRLYIFDGVKWRSAGGGSVDWSQFPNCNSSLSWDPVNECWTATGGGGGGGFVGCGDDFAYDSVNDCWSINWEELPTCGSLVYDTTNKCWTVTGSQIGDSPPSPAPPGTLWWDTESGRLFISYDDGNTTQWVPTTPEGGGGSGNGSAIELLNDLLDVQAAKDSDAFLQYNDANNRWESTTTIDGGTF